MKMSDLKSYGFPKELISIWEQEESKNLLPIQAKAIKDFKILDKNSKNLLVIAPTSSGKTFVGELAAVKEALAMRKAFFLVPFRAIAEELFLNFNKKYKSYGLRIVISDRDHREYDNDIINGEYQIGIAVYEKLAGLLVMNPHLFSKCGLVIADEVQMLRDPERGPKIEVLLTKLLLSDERVRIIALSAVLDELNKFDKWLNAQVLLAKCRPVELREAVYRGDGDASYREFNSRKPGKETLSRWEKIEDGLLSLVQRFIKKNEQALIFCRARRSTIEIAHMLAKSLSHTSPAIETIRKAEDLTDSATREEIQNLLQYGIAYHNSDLGLEERLLIEDGFRRKEIKIITCTSTLSMGVNMPAQNVIVYEPQKWNGQKFVPIDVAEYKNMIGRAGRYSTGDKYGCSYLLAQSPAEADSYKLNYVNGRLEGFESSFGKQAIDAQVLEIIAGGFASTDDEIRQFVFSTYNGQHKWTTNKSKEVINKMISEAIDTCIEYQAIEVSKDRKLTITKQGRLCATGGYQLNHLRNALSYLANNKGDVPISVIYWSLATDAVLGNQAYHIGRLQTSEFSSWKYQQALVQLANAEPVGALLDDFVTNLETIDYDRCVILRRCLACYSWISSTTTRQIEKNFKDVTLGAIRNTAEICAWLISFLGELAKILEPQKERHRGFEILAERLSFGAIEEALQLCRIRDNGLSRDERNHLIEKGIKTIDDVLAHKPADFQLTRRKALRLIRAAESTIKDNIERRKRFQQTRLSSLGIDTTIIRRLYEEKGKQLENAIDDLLKKPFITLICRQVTIQREGEPDHLLYDSKENVFVIQTTASDKKNIPMTKATSVIGQSSKYRPKGYIVLGRPDFEALAIKDSQNQKSAKRNYKLIAIPVLAEMFVLVHEGKLTSRDVENILISFNGYLSFEDLAKYVDSKKDSTGTRDNEFSNRRKRIDGTKQTKTQSRSRKV